MNTSTTTNTTNTIRIALANLRAPTCGDESVELAERAVADAASRDAAIVCFPECFVPGYRANKPIAAPSDAFLEDAWRRIARAARDAGIAVVLGTERTVDGARRLSALVIDRDGETVGVQDKVQLDPSEESAYSAAAARQLFQLGPLTFGIVICHEGWRYPETVRWAARRGAKLVFHPHYDEPEPGAYRPTTFADPANTFHEKSMLCRAAENTIWFASVNCAVPGSATTSAIVRPNGTLLAHHPYGEHGLLLADIDLDEATGLLASRCKS